MSYSDSNVAPLSNHGGVDDESNLCQVPFASPSKRRLLRSHSTVAHVVMVDRGRNSLMFEQVFMFWFRNKFSWLLLTIPASIIAKAVGWNCQVFILRFPFSSTIC